MSLIRPHGKIICSLRGWSNGNIRRWEEEQAIVGGPPKTTLTGYFDRVIYERTNPLSETERGFADDGSINPTGLDLTNSEFVSFYTWLKKERK